ncbi:MAG: hypothetical protein WDN04_23230 [Rhodospirillales bacterium]
MTQEQWPCACRHRKRSLRGWTAGRGKPSTRMLERFAEATGTRLRIVF